MKNIVILILFFQNYLLFAEDKPADEITRELRLSYSAFTSQCGTLAEIAKDSTTSWTVIEAQYLSTRLAYKKIEFFTAYLDREYNNDHFNGAPLPRIERKTSQLTVVDPCGLQTIGEAISEEDRESIRDLSQQLNARTTEYLPYFNRIELSERMVFEAMREGLVRLAALGITGFDSPLENQTIPACREVVEALEHTLSFYSPLQSEASRKRFKELFNYANTALINNDFDNFNRFEFIQKFINPIYSSLLVLQDELFIPTRDLNNDVLYSVNYKATNIFDTDFLDFRYFSKYSNAGVPEKREELGKLLFFDPILSHDNERSCVSCHNPKTGFADGKPKSLASNNKGTLQRNSPTLMNSVFNTRFFWDVRASSPEDQIEHVIFSEKEFNTNYDEILAKLNQSEDYLALFRAAYPELQNTRFQIISRYTLVASISAYLQSLRSFNSRFDQTIRGELSNDPKMIAGFNIFAGKAKCATCHFIPTFAGNVPPLYDETETEIIGVPNTSDRKIAKLDEDLGRYANGRPKEKAPHQKNAFKTVSLRNVALTAPYMHNGVFQTLDEVMDFYNVGGGHGWGIGPVNATLSPDSLHLTPAEIDQVIYFLEALTDTVGFTHYPLALPSTTNEKLNARMIGGTY